MATLAEKQFLDKFFDIEELQEIGFFDTVPKEKEELNYDEMITRICSFFGLKNIFEYKYLENINYIKRPHSNNFIPVNPNVYYSQN